MRTSTRLVIAFDDVGDGEPALVCLPGWCSNRTVFRPMLPRLARGHRTVALDWRDHGGSERPAADYTTDDLVDDAIAVLDESGVGRAVPVALSHAGWAAIEMRRRLGPERVPGMVLLDWMVLGPPPPFVAALAALQDPRRWESTRAELFRMWSTGTDLPALDAHIGEMAEYGFDTWARAGREIAARFESAGSPVAALERIDPPCPTLHVYAQPADDALLAAQVAYAGVHPWFAVHRLDAKSHFPMFEVPDDLSEVIEAFVAALPAASAR
ncbi:MAG TPA: alpha/beta hydrolase [Acidimicrobiales bacterium]|nr:alpha/beta hydrolase [Acidimicrobiales bacterium]